MKNIFLFVLSVLPFLSWTFEENDPEVVKPNFKCEFNTCYLENDSIQYTFVQNKDLYLEEWSLLNQPNFWRNVMTLSPDSCVINIAKNRFVVEKLSIETWDKKSDKSKENYRDSIRKVYDLSDNDKIYMTTGKADFYAFDKVLPSVSRGVEVFKKENTHPWYAQAILMIESPGKLAKSNVGAYGAFQLMPSVARSHGLTVNKYKDERQDFDKSAKAASSLIRNTCIPKAIEILDSKDLEYDENSLSFRLLVLHVYHAGYANVKAVFEKINPDEFNSDVIQKMWVTQAAKFKNASQNYSQLAIAAMMILDDIVESTIVTEKPQIDEAIDSKG